jgi:hypothetical protein
MSTVKTYRLKHNVQALFWTGDEASLREWLVDVPFVIGRDGIARVNGIEVRPESYVLSSDRPGRFTTLSAEEFEVEYEEITPKP